MGLIEWAEKEVKLACARENPDRKEGEFDYGCACYESALKAYKSLMEDKHSGFSIGITKQILNRLIDGKPLTPIEDTDDMWNKVYIHDAIQTYQCKRMSSLFKDVYPDGTVRYHDVNSSYCVSINNPNIAWDNGFVRNVIDGMFPIIMPYIPGNPIKVYCEEFLTDEKNGDYVTMGILYVIKPDGVKVEINRYFKEEELTFVEIDETEYEERRKRAIRKE